MARVLSSAVTSLEANAYLSPQKAPHMMREVSGVVTPAADQSASDFLHFCRVPSNAIVTQVMITAADATTGGAIDIGVWYKADQPPLRTAPTTVIAGTAVDDDLFASAFDLAGGPYTNADVTYESGEYTLAESEKPLWEVLGLSEDPNTDFDIASDITTVFNGGPTAIKLVVRYHL